MGEPSWPVAVDGKKGSYLLLHRIPEVASATSLQRVPRGSTSQRPIRTGNVSDHLLPPAALFKNVWNSVSIHTSIYVDHKLLSTALRWSLHWYTSIRKYNTYGSVTRQIRSRISKYRVQFRF